MGQFYKLYLDKITGFNRIAAQVAGHFVMVFSSPRWRHRVETVFKQVTRQARNRLRFVLPEATNHSREERTKQNVGNRRSFFVITWQ